MTETLEAVVVGVGTIGERHARILHEGRETNLRAVVDLDEELAEDVGADYDADVVAADLEETLAAHTVDFVVVATPESTHLDVTRAALDEDCHVLLEKPIAETAADAERIGDLADAADTELMIAYCCRFDPEYASLKAEIDDGAVGDVLGVQAARIGSVAAYERVGAWTHPVYYLAVHDIDMLRWYTDSEVARVHAYASTGLDVDGTGGAEDGPPAIITTTLEFEDGAVGTLETNWARPEGHPTYLTQEVRVTGTDGYSRLVVEDDGVPVTTADGHEWAPTTEPFGDVQDMYRFQMDHFVDCVREGREPLVTWEDGIESLRVANAIRESLDTGTPVEL